MLSTSDTKIWQLLVHSLHFVVNSLLVTVVNFCVQWRVSVGVAGLETVLPQLENWGSFLCKIMLNIVAKRLKILPQLLRCE